MRWSSSPPAPDLGRRSLPKLPKAIKRTSFGNSSVPFIRRGFDSKAADARHVDVDRIDRALLRLNAYEERHDDDNLRHRIRSRSMKCRCCNFSEQCCAAVSNAAHRKHFGMESSLMRGAYTDERKANTGYHSTGHAAGINYPVNRRRSLRIAIAHAIA